MKTWIKTAAALALSLGALGFTAASADDHGRDRRGDHRDGDHRDGDYRGNDRRGDYRDGDYRDGDRRGGDRRYSDQRYSSVRPERCYLDHDHRYHNRDYYSYYPKDRYYNADPGFSVSLNFGNGYYDRSGAYYKRPYYDQRGYRNYGRVVNREVINLRGYRADAVLVEEAYDGRRGGNLVCTVTARGPDASYVPYGQLRSIAARYCSRSADIRVYT